MRIYLLTYCILLSIISRAENADSLYSKSISFLNTANWDSTIIHGEFALSQAIIEQNKTVEINSHYLIAYAKVEVREFGEALIHYLSAAELAEYSDDENHKSTLIGLYQNIASIMRSYKHYDLCYTYNNKAIKWAEKNTNKAKLYSIKHNVINLLIEDGKSHEAESLINEILGDKEISNRLKNQLLNNLGRLRHDGKQYDEARFFYERVANDVDYPESLKNVALFNIAMTYFDEGNYDRATLEFEKTIKSCSTEYDNNWLFKSNRYLALAYEKLNKVERAKEEFQQAILTSNLPNVDPDSYIIYKDASNFHASQNEMNEALEYQNKYTYSLEKHLEEQNEILIQDKKYNMQLITEKFFDNLKAKELERKAKTNTRNTAIILTCLFLLIFFGIYYKQRLTKISLANALNEIESNSKV